MFIHSRKIMSRYHMKKTIVSPNLFCSIHFRMHRGRMLDTKKILLLISNKINVLKCSERYSTSEYEIQNNRLNTNGTCQKCFLRAQSSRCRLAYTSGVRGVLGGNRT